MWCRHVEHYFRSASLCYSVNTPIKLRVCEAHEEGEHAGGVKHLNNVNNK